MPRNPVPVVSESDRKVLESWVRSTSVPAGLARRARIVLLAADGVGTNEIVDKTGSTRPTVTAWRNRYIAEGLAGLDDRPKKGREPEIDQIEVINATLQAPPEHLGITHWSSRILGKQLAISNVTVAKIWKRWGIKPFNRTAPILPMRPDLPEKWTHDYVRHGTTTLFAALEVATGKVTQTCLPRHRSDEFLRFLKQVAKAYPRVQLHLVVDNYATHKHPRVKAWLAQNPRVTMHFTPTSGSWLNMVEIFFGIITRQAIRRGAFNSVTDLIGAITRFIDNWNTDCQPFTWTKTADEIIPHATRGKGTSFTRH